MGGIVYDLIETRVEAERICTLLNRGVPAEWDILQKYL